MAFGLFSPAAFDGLFGGMYHVAPASCRTAAYRGPSFVPDAPTYVLRPAPPKPPTVRISQHPSGSVIVTAVLPGYSREDISVDVDGGVLTISATPGAHCDCWECSPYALPPLSKSFRLPPFIDQAAVSARFEQGVLTVLLPRRVVEQQRRVVIVAAPPAVPGPLHFRPQPVAAVRSSGATSAVCRPTAGPAMCCPGAAPAVRRSVAAPAGSSQAEWARISSMIRAAAAAHASRASPTPSAGPAPVPAGPRPQPRTIPVEAPSQPEPSTVPVVQQASPAQTPTETPAEETPAEAEAGAGADPKGKRPMTPSQEAAYVMVQAEAKKVQARLQGEEAASSDEEDGSIEECEF